MTDIRLSEHFLLSEFTRSSTAERLGICNELDLFILLIRTLSLTSAISASKCLNPFGRMQDNPSSSVADIVHLRSIKPSGEPLVVNI